MDPLANGAPAMTASAASVQFPFNNEPASQTRQFQAAAYSTLVEDGGRPSHPLCLLERIVYSPGRYSDILAYWQDRSDEWQVFHKQLSRWQAFRAHQGVSRDADGFEEYVLDLRERFDRHGFELPNGYRTPPNGLSFEMEKQSKVATWIEYINYELIRREEDEEWLETYRPSYDAALAQLMDAQVLEPFELVRTPTSDICSPSSSEIAKREAERRKAEDECEVAKRRMEGGFDSLKQTQVPQEMEEHERVYSEAMLRLKAINDRDWAISEFGRKSHAYRFAMDRLERHELLLRWAVNQIPLIEEEISHTGRRDAALRKGRRNWRLKQQAQTFPQFQRLPPEIRHRIWEEMLPKSPSVHFFDVLNCEHPCQLVPSWSSDEFRVRATRHRDSGYLPVYSLLATCRESRSIVEMYYIRRRRGVSCPLSGRPINFSDRPPDFRTFDWIPSDDLMVLCFPPVQVAQLPCENAFSLAPGPNQAARRLGLMIPRDLLSRTQFDPIDDGETDDGAAELALIPEFINHLHSEDSGPEADAALRGIWKLYLMVEGWSTNHIQMQLTAKIDSKRPVSDWADGIIHWRPPSAKRGGRMLPWKSISEPPPGPELPLGTIINIMQNNPAFFSTSFNHSNQRIVHQPASESGGGARQLYWLGSSRPALGTLRPDDLVQERSAQKLHDFMQILEMQCRAQQWHHNFGGVEALGWLEPASGGSLDAAEVRELERATKRAGKWPGACERMKRERWDDEEDL
ncbi:hypothetical protein HDV57DRAFT_178728 [Trichoderma longibrachiatum]